MKYKNFLSRLKPEQRRFVLERLGRKEQDFVLMMRRLRQRDPVLFKQIWMAVKKSTVDLSDMFQSVQDVYSCEDGVVEGEVQRTYTVYLKGPKIVGDVSKAMVAQADELAQMVKGKRKWTFGHDNRICTCNLTPTAAKLLEKNKHVEKVVEEKMATICYGEYAPYPAYSAGVENTDWGITKCNPSFAWAKNIKGQGVKVCVVDTGIDKNHVDLIHCYKGGYNFITGTDDPVDDHMHGTYCCGIVAGADNNLGYKGIAHECDLYACKVLNSKGSGSFGDIAAAVDWCRVNEMDIVSMSLGGDAQCTGVLADAVNVAWAAGLVIVAASGNDGPDEDTVLMPGNCGATIAIGSIDKDEFLSGFSSRGPEMEISAPGEGITAAWLVGHDMYGDRDPAQVGVHIVGTSWYWANGTCLAGDSEVYTSAGPKQIQDIRKDDDVYCFNEGQLVKNKVNALLPQGDKEVFEIKTGDGRTIKATENHPFLIKKGSNTLGWEPVSKLKNGDLVVAVSKLPENIDPYFDSLITEEMAKALGFFLADGWIQRNRKTNKVFLARGLEEKTREFKEAFENVFGEKFKEADKWYCLNSKRIALVLSLLGLKQPHRTAFLPLWLYSISQQKIKSFIHGFLAGDGYYRKDYNSCRLEIASKELANGLKHLCRYVGYKATDVWERTRLNTAPNSPNRLKEYKTSYNLWINFNGHRKSSGLKKVANIDWFHSTSIKSIKSIGIEDVYDIEVQDAHNFIANGIVVHNSAACPHVAGAAALIKCWYPDATNYDIRGYLRDNAKDL